MNNAPQMDLSLPALVDHEVSGAHIHQRPKDGYINATQLRKAAGKQWAHYIQNANTKAFIDELSAVNGIPLTGLIHKIQGGPPTLQGTWIHPDIATNLGQWLSPKFAVWAAQCIRAWVEGTTRGYMPPHVKRYMMNKAKIPATHFSMLNEIYLEILAPIDDAGVRIPSKIVPDISTGKMFSGFLRDKGINPNEFPYYNHEFPDGRVVRARLYPIEYLSPFRIWTHGYWLPERAENYFKERLPQALPHIQHLLAAPATQKALGRPARKIAPIKDTPERVAKSVMQGAPKQEWNYKRDGE